MHLPLLRAQLLRAGGRIDLRCLQVHRRRADAAVHQALAVQVHDGGGNTAQQLQALQQRYAAASRGAVVQQVGKSASTATLLHQAGTH